MSMKFSVNTLRRIALTAVIPCLAALQACMAVPIAGLAASLAPTSNSGSSGNSTYQVSADYDKVFTAVQSAVAELAKIGISDRQTGMIQGQAGAAKTITAKIARANPGTTFQVDVVNVAGIYAMFDKSNEGKTIADRVSSSLSLPVNPANSVAPAGR